MLDTPPAIHLRLFGTPDLRTPEGSKAHAILAQSKHVALLAMLATSRESVWRRDRLIGLLWPELDDDRARNALSKAIHNVRRALGEDALVGRFAEEVGIQPAHWSCDVWEFEDSLERGAFADAMALYRRGEWLEGFHIPDASALEHWIDGERDRFRRRAVEAALTLADQAERAGEGAAAAEHLRWAGEWSPFDETILRRRMTLLDRQADRAGAISTFNDFAARLQRELDAAPSPESVALLETIRQRAVIPVVSGYPRAQEPAVVSDADAALIGSPPAIDDGDTTPSPATRHFARVLWVFGGVAALFAVGATVRDSSNLRPSRAQASSADSILSARRDYRTIVLLMGPGEESDSILRRDAYKVVESTLASDTLFRVVGDKYVSAQLLDARMPEAFARNRDTIAANARFMGHAVGQLGIGRFGTGFTLSMVLSRTDRTKPIATYTGVATDSSALPEVLRALVDSTAVALRRASPELRTAVNARLYSPVAVQLFNESHVQNNRGNYLAAVDLARAAIRADSNYLGAWNALAGFLGNAGLHRAERLLAATKQFELRQRGPLSAELWYAARWYAARRLYDSAYAAEKARPDGNYANFQGSIRSAQGEYALAEQEYRRMLLAAPRSGLDQRNLALALIDQGKLAEADSLIQVMAPQPRLRRWVMELRGSRAAAVHDHVALLKSEEQVLADSTADSASRLRALSRLRAVRAMTGNIRASDSLARLLQTRQDSLRDPGSVLETAANRAILLAPVGPDAAVARRLLAETTARYPLERMAFMDRPYPALITAHVQLRNLRQAQRLLDEWERDVPPLFRLVDAAAIADARGELMLATGRPQDALRFFRANRVGNCAACENISVARAFDAMGQVDSAVFYFGRYLDLPSTNRSKHDMLWLGYALRRTGEIHEERGDIKRALIRYESFVELRARSDAEFATETDDVRGRIDRLRRR